MQILIVSAFGRTISPKTQRSRKSLFLPSPLVKDGAKYWFLLRTRLQLSAATGLLHRKPRLGLVQILLLAGLSRIRIEDGVLHDSN